MLIRSQNKEVLVNFDVSAGIKIAEWTTKTVITSYITGCSYLLGEYSNKTKAMKVLNMIQEAYSDFESAKITSTGLATAAYAISLSYDTPENIFDGINALKEYGDSIKELMVFQMPDDGSVEV